MIDQSPLISPQTFVHRERDGKESMLGKDDEMKENEDMEPFHIFYCDNTTCQVCII